MRHQPKNHIHPEEVRWSIIRPFRHPAGRLDPGGSEKIQKLAHVSTVVREGRADWWHRHCPGDGRGGRARGCAHGPVSKDVFDRMIVRR